MVTLSLTGRLALFYTYRDLAGLEEFAQSMIFMLEEYPFLVGFLPVDVK